MIVDPPIQDVLAHADCRYTLIVEVAKRARQLVGGAEPLVRTAEFKPVSVAVREISDGYITYVRNEELE